MPHVLLRFLDGREVVREIDDETATEIYVIDPVTRRHRCFRETNDIDGKTGLDVYLEQRREDV